jgi:hypothetical protein
MTSLEENWSAIGTGTAGLPLNNAVNNYRVASTPLLGILGTTNYNSLQARMRANLPGVSLTAGYTFAKNLGFIVPSSVQGGAAMPWLYRTYDYGPLPFDISHNLQVTAVAEVPFGKNKRWLSSGKAGLVLGGWQVSALFSRFTGRPFSVVANATSLNAVNSFQFANCISTPHQTGDIYQWYDVSAFAAPSNGTFGNCGQNVLRGPGLINADAGLERRFPIKERFAFRFRAEMFNLSNTPHHASPGFNSSTGTTSANSISSSSFMQAFNIANTGRDGLDQRTLRLSLKLSW